MSHFKASPVTCYGEVARHFSVVTEGAALPTARGMMVQRKTRHKLQRRPLHIFNSSYSYFHQNEHPINVQSDKKHLGAKKLLSFQIKPYIIKLEIYADLFPLKELGGLINDENVKKTHQHFSRCSVAGIGGIGSNDSVRFNKGSRAELLRD